MFSDEPKINPNPVSSISKSPENTLFPSISNESSNKKESPKPKNDINKEKESETLPIINSNKAKNENNNNSNENKIEMKKNVSSSPQIMNKQMPNQQSVVNNNNIPQFSDIKKNASDDHLLDKNMSISFPNLPSDSLTEISDSQEKLEISNMNKSSPTVNNINEKEYIEQLKLKSKSAPIIKNNSSYGKEYI